MLDYKLSEFKFDNAPFIDVVEFFRQEAHLEVFVNWRSLEAGGRGGSGG